jgi:hypothetical protein
MDIVYLLINKCATMIKTSFGGHGIEEMMLIITVKEENLLLPYENKIKVLKYG